jgi:hypothetical protein
MTIVRIAILVLTLNTAGFMLFDGGRALIKGDYLTPKSGRYAGQLGPWKHLVSAVGIGPRSTAMKWIFVGYGAAWLAIAGCFAARLPFSWWAMVVAAVGSLWYLVFGTLASAVILVLLLLPGGRL